MRILAFDPGVTTGFADAEASSDGFVLTMAGQFSWDKRFATLKVLLNSKPEPSLVIVESFRLYAHKAEAQINSDFPSVRVIGAIETYLDSLDLLHTLVFQSASAIARTQVLDEHRSLLFTEHARDAYKHLRYYVVTKMRPR